MHFITFAFRTSHPGSFPGALSSLLVSVLVGCKSCSCLYWSRCRRTRAHKKHLAGSTHSRQHSLIDSKIASLLSRSAALTERLKIASSLSLSDLNPASTRPDLARVRLRVRGPLNLFSPALHPQTQPPLSAVSHAVSLDPYCSTAFLPVLCRV